MRKMLSFLGTGSYRATHYRHPDGEEVYETPFVQEALVEFYRPERLYVLLTPGAERNIPKDADRSNWEALRERLEGRVELVPVRGVPEGASEAELWQMFDLVTGCFEPGDRVIFDLTHGFRSLPVIALIAVAFLRVACDVRVEGLVYGAFEARDPETGVAPLYDLLPIVTLLDWTTATDQFLKTGDAGDLSVLLREVQGRWYRERSGVARSELPQHLNRLSDALEGVSAARALVRPLEATRALGALRGVLAEAAQEFDRWAPPFRLLLERVRQDCAAVALLEGAEPAEQVRAHRELIRWYLERRHYLHAALLAREWVVSVIALHAGGDWTDHAVREEVERALNAQARWEQGKEFQEAALRERVAALPEVQRETALRLWNRVGQLRNDLAHCGMRAEKVAAKKLANNLEGLREHLDAVAQAFQLM
ncbi:MAG: TIGR02221 family CRISPR-associated protein [Chloroherpetonaceae bacterium]|nr:TIGR02221 family CRISPR-associated protein [Chthonomonadaceae bacterium]MDW8209109.1 TIGR02221 family CRISPR-associated protein [Chloroherpetonaceae bacterium]